MAVVELEPREALVGGLGGGVVPQDERTAPD
jgi:hypothetical protein